uniref:Uncharacterized protein n=1 Tax=Physcomitrium patens TaxID=3218 RepID=A0A2K1JVA6_PHYPA|nr:hypothetical protein PHYPA_015235 [Physcomitrium patens]
MTRNGAKCRTPPRRTGDGGSEVLMILLLASCGTFVDEVDASLLLTKGGVRLGDSKWVGYEEKHTTAVVS